MFEGAHRDTLCTCKVVCSLGHALHSMATLLPPVSCGPFVTEEAEQDGMVRNATHSRAAGHLPTVGTSLE